MNLYACDPSAVKEESEGWSKVQESNRFLEDLLESVTLKLVCQARITIAILTANMKIVVSSSVDHLYVTSLREELEEAKLQLDGSCEIIIESLKRHKKKLYYLSIVEVNCAKI